MNFRIFIIFSFCFHLLLFNSTRAQTDSTSSLAFDFGITRGRNINLWPIFKRYKDADKKELQVAYPLFSKTINYRLGIKHSQAIPFYIADSSSTITETRLLSLYYPSLLHLTKRNEGGDQIRSFNFLELAPNISMLGLSRSSKGLFVENNMFFFIWYKRDSIQNKSRLIVFPLYWYNSNTFSSSHLLLPAFYHYQNPGYKKLNIALLYQHEKSPKKNSHRLFPLWWYKNKYQQGDTTYRRVLFPIYWSKKNNTENNLTIFPVLFSYKNPQYRSLTVFPLFSKGQSPEGMNKHFYVLPLYWHHKNPQSTSHVFFPLWWYAKTPLETTRTLFPLYWQKKAFVYGDILRETTLFPVYWSTRTSYKNNKVIFPLLFSFRDTASKSLTVFPLFSSGSSADKSSHYLNIYPFYLHKKNEQKSSHIVLPFWWSLREYGKHDTSTYHILFPLYWAIKDKERSNRILFPMVYSLNNETRKSITVFPFYTFYRNKQTTGITYAVTPLLWHHQSPEKTSTTLFPVYWYLKTSSKQHHVFFPFVFSYRDTAYRSFTLLPLFSAGRSNNGLTHHLNLFPIYWQHHTLAGNSRVIFPLWWYYRNYGSTDTTIFKTLFPVYWSVQNHQKNNQVIFPLVYSYHNQAYQSFTLFPIYSAGHSTDLRSSYKAITPLYWHIKDTTATKDWLLPLYWRKKYYTGHSVDIKNIFFPVYWSHKSKQSSQVWRWQSLTLIPFFHYGYSDKGAQNLMIAPAYWYQRNLTSVKHIVFPLWWYSRTRSENGKDTSAILFPVYWSHQNSLHKNKVLFPLLYSFNSYSSWKSFTVFPLFSIGNNKITKESQLALTPLYWHYKGTDKSRYALFLLFWAKNNYYRSDTIRKRVLFPVYWSGQSNSYSNKVLFPVIFSLKNKHYHSFTLFPLFSVGHATKKYNKYWMITPLAGRFREDNRDHRFFFPLFNYKKKTDKTFTSVLLFGYRRTKEPNQTRTSILWPLCEKVSTPHYNTFRLAPFIWKTKSDTASMFACIPLTYQYKSATKQTFRLGWFLYHYNNIPGTVVSQNLLWKVYERDRYHNGSYETRLLHLLYANVNLPEKREKSLFPFYYSVSYPNGDKSVSVLFSFYNYFKQYKPEIKEFYQEERIFWFLRLRSNYEQLKRNGKDFKRR